MLVLGSRDDSKTITEDRVYEVTVMTPYFASRKAPWQLLLIFFILVILISSVGLYYYESHKRQIKKEKQDELLAIADLKVSQIVSWRKERLADAATIRDNFLLAPYIQRLIQDPKGAKGRTEILAWMASFRETYQYEDILFLNSEGAILLSVAKKSEAIGPDARKLISSAIKMGKIIFSDLYRSKAVGKIRLSIAVPILNEERDETLGVFLLRIDPYVFLYPLIERWPTRSTTAETMLIRREGDEVVFLNDVRHRKGTALTLRLPISDEHLPAAKAAAGKEGILEGIDYRGKEVLAALRSVSGSPWAIVSKVDKEEVYAPIRERLGHVVLVIGLCILSAGAGVVLLWRRRGEEEQKAYRENLEKTVKERTAELEIANKHLEESYKDMEGFSYSVSHDLREPLIVIDWFSGNLQKKYAERLNEDQKEMLSGIREKAKQMTQLINDLLAFSRASTKEIQKSFIDMKALVQELSEEMKTTTGDRNVQFESKDLPVAWGDPPMIRQVLVNLLSNALKYSRAEEIARIEVGGTEKERESVYYVRDNGIGFDAGHADKLFSLFKRLHTSQEFEGTGLGLVIAKRIVEKHGGRIWAESKPDEGATFFFTLPRKP